MPIPSSYLLGICHNDCEFSVHGILLSKVCQGCGILSLLTFTFSKTFKKENGCMVGCCSLQIYIVLHCPCSHLLDGYRYFIHFMIYVKQIIWNCLCGKVCDLCTVGMKYLDAYNTGFSIRKDIVNLCWHSAISHLWHLAVVFELLTSLARYELLTPNVIPKGFMDGRKACQKMVCVLQRT